MSTKIYYAWKMPLGGLKKFADKANKQLFNAVVTAVKNAMGSIEDEEVRRIKDQYIAKILQGKTIDQGKTRRLDLQTRMGIVMRMAKNAIYSPFNIDDQCIDLECGITFRIHGKHAYGIGYGRFEFMDAIKSIRPAINYPYWNNTDKPNNISARSWKKRGDTWDAVLEEPVHLIMKAVSFDITDYMTAQRIWEAIYPRPKEEMNFFSDTDVNGKSPYQAAKEAIAELQETNANQEIINGLIAAMPRIPRHL